MLVATGLWAKPEPWKHFVVSLLSIFWFGGLEFRGKGVRGLYVHIVLSVQAKIRHIYQCDIGGYWEFLGG